MKSVIYKIPLAVMPRQLGTEFRIIGKQKIIAFQVYGAENAALIFLGSDFQSLKIVDAILKKFKVPRAPA